MSVRRLADESVQPAAFAFQGENVEWARHTIAKYPQGRQQSAVIPLLMRAQEQEGWVTRPAVEEIAAMLDMPVIRVLEVATFYTQFQLQPVGTRAHVQICGTTPCMLRGAEDLVALCRRKIAAQPFELSADGALSWEEVECQGACVNAPMVMIFKDTYEDLDPARLEEIIDAFADGRGGTIEAGPQVDRHFSAPQGGLTSLNDDEDTAAKPDKKKPTRLKKAEASAIASSEAARPETSAEETSPAIKSPSPVKVSAAREAAASEPPAEGLSSKGSASSGKRRAKADAGDNTAFSLEKKAGTSTRKTKASETDPPMVEKRSAASVPGAEEASDGKPAASKKRSVKPARKGRS